MRPRTGTSSASRVFVHVGAPMAGATYLRGCLARHRRRLTRRGVLYPASHLGDDGGHLEAVLDVLDLTGTGLAPSTGAWDRLAETARDWRRGTVVVSHELLADATEQQVQRVVSSFGNVEVHVVYVTRGLGRQVPLAWQEWVRNGGTAPFADYANRVVNRDPHRMSKVFWTSHDAGDVLGRWSAFVPPDRMHVLTVPSGAPGAVLWERFADTIGVDPRRFRAVPDPDPDAASLGLAENEVLRLLNIEAGRRPHPAGVERVRRALGPSSSAAPAMSAVHADRLREETDRQVAAVKNGGYDVVGDVTELMLLPKDLAHGDAQVTPANAAVREAQTRALARLAGVLEDGEGPPGVRRRALRGLLGRASRVRR
ncbi:MAG TPA: hypothetical protein VFG63_01530 [Nocardioidaceae bacterium]|nr:hypothetical protein [Nocardioidaceae bacterium]